MVFYGKSLLGNKEIENLLNTLKKTFSIKGNVIECGVYRGGSLVAIAQALKHFDKKVYGLDTFEGFPYYDRAEKYLFDKHDFKNNNIFFVRLAIKFYKLNNITLMKGKFTDTFKKLKDEKFSFINLDCDLYQSYVECIEFLLPRLQKNGIMFFHDYNSGTAKRSNEAIEKFFNKEDLVTLKPKSAYYIK